VSKVSKVKKVKKANLKLMRDNKEQPLKRITPVLWGRRVNNLLKGRILYGTDEI